eukprot:TRINITY_DN21864_c0_g1_i1.p1 TRINITY_DN21864_c0_g1~~TRINITY_DN21864_c0_g1_i1.p1  ORF type:complete len:254 (+),score=30.25 TRINITY_DN21864_c0_g1_i1:145-906(+)
MAFGTRMEQYRNLKESFYAVVRALLMDFDLQELRNANLWLGPVFFGTFILLAVFVLLNMFIAIISDAYSETRMELQQQDGLTYGFVIWDVFVNEILGKMWIIGPIVGYVKGVMSSSQLQPKKDEGEAVRQARSKQLATKWRRKAKAREVVDYFMVGKNKNQLISNFVSRIRKHKQKVHPQDDNQFDNADGEQDESSKMIIGKESIKMSREEENLLTELVLKSVEQNIAENFLYDDEVMSNQNDDQVDVVTHSD